jgi:hypothetical protein
LTDNYLDLYESNLKIQGYIDALEFISLIEMGDLEQAIEFS